MTNREPITWHFTNELDNVKAEANGITLDSLYNRVDSFVAPYGNIRVERRTYVARKATSGFYAH